MNQKGPQAAFLAALHALRGAGRKPPVNLVLVAEGEEEIGSPHFAQIVRRPEVQQALSRCFGVFMPSAEQGLDGNITLSLGAKGVVELEREIHGGRGCAPPGRSRRQEAAPRSSAGCATLGWRESLERFCAAPTVNIEGIVAGYTGPGGKTILPHRAAAKLDLRLVPDMTAQGAVAALKASRGAASATSRCA